MSNKNINFGKIKYNIDAIMSKVDKKKYHLFTHISKMEVLIIQGLFI
jgi:hypothetical protein